MISSYPTAGLSASFVCPKLHNRGDRHVLAIILSLRDGSFLLQLPRHFVPSYYHLVPPGQKLRFSTVCQASRFGKCQLANACQKFGVHCFPSRFPRGPIRLFRDSSAFEFRFVDLPRRLKIIAQGGKSFGPGLVVQETSPCLSVIVLGKWDERGKVLADIVPLEIIL